VASETEVLNLWKGLGYYSRARNLHATSIHISTDLKGEFPSTYDELIKLKGVGSYTAAAIASFAFDEPKAVLDGNVYRVLSRLFGVETPIDSTQGNKEFQALANEMLDYKNPAQHNQAIMEFGALQCTPMNPKCNDCPLDFMCEAKTKNLVKKLPVKTGKTKVSNKYFVFQIIKEKGNLLLEKRDDSGIWKNMYQFPLIEFQSASEKLLFLKEGKFDYISNEVKHVLSHQHLFCNFVLSLKKLELTQRKHIWVDNISISDFPLPRVIERFIEENFKIIFNVS
jgi:A/G-specific adenine glycosylase